MHGSREIEAATDGQIEVRLDRTRNHGRYGPGTQGLFQRPEHVLVFARLNQDQPMRIEPKLLQAMAVEVAIRKGATARDENGMPSAGTQRRSSQSQHKAQHCRPISMRLWRHLVQQAAAQPTARQPFIQLADAERQDRHGLAHAPTFQCGHHLAQLLKALRLPPIDERHVARQRLGSVAHSGRQRKKVGQQWHASGKHLKEL